MNVVILNDAASIRGGADRIAIDSARCLAERGHTVAYLSAFGPVDASLRNVPNLSVTCLEIGWLRQNQSSVSAALNGMWNFKAAKAVRGLLAGFNPAETVVHVHLYSSGLTASVLHTALKAGFKTVLTLHDYFITCPNGAYFVFPRAELCGRSALSLSCLKCNCDSRKRSHKVFRVARTWIQNKVARIPRKLTAYAAVSETCAALARRDLPATARIEVVSNIVAVNRQPPVDVAEKKSFVFTGRLETYKGPHLLAMAAARANIPVVFCGTGPLEPELKRLYPSARFTGWLSPAGIMAELSEARAFVFPSVYRETFGLSAAEALARGIPVIASRGTAAEEFVHHDVNGLLFTHNSVDDLARQLATLSDDTVVRRLGQSAYERYWEAPLTEAAHVTRLESFYDAALSGTGNIPALFRKHLPREGAVAP